MADKLVAAPVAVLLLIGTAACSSTPSPTQGSFKIGRPYQVNGVWYYPAENPSYNETGIASWYGEPFHGRRTANGETFDKALMTAAHKTLPMPVLVRVTNLQNGKSLVLRVNDRGPFVAGRIIDVSEEAADLLGFKARGTAPVRVQYLARAPLDPTIAFAENAPAVTPAGEEIAEAAPVTVVAAAELPPPPGGRSAPPIAGRPVTPPAAPPALPVAATPPPSAPLAPPPVVTQMPVAGTPKIYVQAGAFASRANAERLKAEVAGLGRASVAPARINGEELFRVRLGPLNSETQADAILERILRQGIKGAQIIVE